MKINSQNVEIYNKDVEINKKNNEIKKKDETNTNYANLVSDLEKKIKENSETYDSEKKYWIIIMKMRKNG